MIPNWNASIRAQRNHKPTMRAVRVNGQITEVKQLKAKANSKIGDLLGPIYFVFFSLVMIGRTIMQISVTD